MFEEYKISPEDLLSAARQEELRKKTGALKIFLGMAAGVGKTYAMLEAARHKKEENVDLVVGVVDTHGRGETARLLEGLKSIPPKKIIYRDAAFEEMDLDEILRLKPTLALVDELAHSNIPGSRHPKRWQDVLELLDAGINVYTTLNVQHIESRKDLVESITGITVRETVPDLILERATQIELVDLSPEDLLIRLKEGKVYLGDQSQMAAQNFFKEDNLTALRELALRFTAEKVDHDLHGLTLTGISTKKWLTRDKLMAAVSSHPNSHYIIRNTRRRAFRLDAPWLAVYVDNGTVLSEEESKALAKNLALASNLGAEVITVTDPDIDAALARIARHRNVTEVVVGRPARPTFLDIFWGGNLVERLAYKIPGIDIHVVHQPYNISRSIAMRRLWTFTSKLSDYFKVTLLVGLLTAFNGILIVYSKLLGADIGFTYIFLILVLSLFFLRGPLIFAAALSSIAWNILFMINNPSPIYDWGYIVYVIIYFAMAMVTGILAGRIREREALLQKREEKTQAIYEIVRVIASARTNEQAFKAVSGRLGSLLNGDSTIIIKDQENRLDFTVHESFADNEKERAVAIWCFENGKTAGWGTDTLPSVSRLYVPIRGYHESVGVLCVNPHNNRSTLSLEELNIIYTVAQQLGYYLERYFSEERVRQQEYKHKIEKLHQTLFSSMSVDFKTPILTIKNAVQHLKSDKPLTRVYENAVINQIENSSENLSRFVENILLMAQIGTGFFFIDAKPQSIADLMEACINNLQRSLMHHKVKVSVQDNLPLVQFDFSLLEILLCNLLLNAASYSPDKSTIEIEAKIEGNYLRLSVKDQGKGIPADLLHTIFQKFYKIPGTTTEGMGLGLPIAKAIAEMHRGHLEAKNRKEGGAEFYLLLPLKQMETEKPRKLKRL